MRIRTQDDLRPFVLRVLVVVGIGSLVAFLWMVAEALLLVFGGALLAILFLHGSRAVSRLTGLPRWAGLALVLLLIGGTLFATFWQLGAELLAQFGALSDQIPQAVDALPQEVRDEFYEAGGWFSRLRTVATTALGLVANLVLLVFVAIYIAASPDLYRRGVLLLVPPAQHARAAEVMDAMGHALWRWMLGTFVSMVIVGVATATGLYLLGLPTALALGIMAGVLEFVPLVGPIIAAVPAVLLALTQGPELALWVAALYVLIQQVEGNLVLPLVQARAVSLPPVVTLAAITAGGLLFGFLGVFLATPLAVAAMVLVNMLYVEDTLGERSRFPG
jgi:predicted PurR-regulated permease PerM